MCTALCSVAKVAPKAKVVVTSCHLPSQPVVRCAKCAAGVVGGAWDIQHRQAGSLAGRQTVEDLLASPCWLAHLLACLFAV